MLTVLQVAAVPIVMEEYADNTNNATHHNTSATHPCSPAVHWNWIYHNHSQEPGTQLNGIQTNPDLLSTSGTYELTPDIYESIPEYQTTASETSASILDSSPSTSQLSTTTSKFHVASKELCESPLQNITQVSSSLSLEILPTTSKSAMSTMMSPVTTSESSVFTNKYKSESRLSESCSLERSPSTSEFYASTPKLCRSISMPELSIFELSSFRPGFRIEISRSSDITYFFRGSTPKSSKAVLPMSTRNRSGSMGKLSQTIIAPLEYNHKSNESKFCEPNSCNFKSYESKSFDSKSCQSKSHKSKSCNSNSGNYKSCEVNSSDFKSCEFESISFEDHLSLSDRSYKGVRAGLEHILDIRRTLIKEHPQWNISSHKLPGLYWSFPQLYETEEGRRDKPDSTHTETGDKIEGSKKREEGRRDVASNRNITLEERIEGNTEKEDKLRLLARNESRRWRFIGGQLRKMGDQFQLDYEKGRGKTRLELPVVSCVALSVHHCMALSALSLACLGLYITLR